jgi:hypothetical protein
MLAAWMFYQRHKQPILNRTGKIVTTFGGDTLWIFIAQAIFIPLLAALPLSRSLLNNLVLTSLLLASMWIITQRRRVILRTSVYLYGLRLSYNQSKYSYLQKYEELN